MSKQEQSQRREEHLKQYGVLRRSMATIAALEGQLRTEMERVLGTTTIGTHQAVLLAQTPNLLLQSIDEMTGALDEINSIIAARIQSEDDAKEILDRALEGVDERLRSKIIMAIVEGGGLLPSIQKLRDGLAWRRLVYERTIKVTLEEDKETAFNEFGALFFPGTFKLRLEAMTEKELRETIENAVAETKKNPGGVEDILLDELCQRLAKYTDEIPYFNSYEPDPGPDPDPDYTKRLAKILFELDVNCPTRCGFYCFWGFWVAFGIGLAIIVIDWLWD